MGDYTADVQNTPPNYGTGNDGKGIGATQTRLGGFRVSVQDGAGNDVSTSHPLPVGVTASGGTPLDTNVKQWGGTATTLGQKAMSASVPVAIASDDPLTLSNLDGLNVPTNTVTSATTLLPASGGVAPLANGWIDTTGYAGIVVQITAISPNVVTFEQSNDQTNVVAKALSFESNLTFSPSTTLNSASIMFGPKTARYFRVRVSTYSSGSVTGTAFLTRTSVVGTLTAQLSAGGNNLASISVNGAATAGSTGIQTAAAIYGINPSGNIEGVKSTTERGISVSVRPTADAVMGITPIVSASVESSHVLKASAGNLYDIYATVGASAGYLMVFNATSPPADGAVTPVECVPVAANSTVRLSYLPGPPVAYATGITAVFSTTGPFTKTASATAFFHGMVQ